MTTGVDVVACIKQHEWYYEGIFFLRIPRGVFDVCQFLDGLTGLTVVKDTTLFSLMEVEFAWLLDRFGVGLLLPSFYSDLIVCLVFT